MPAPDDVDRLLDAGYQDKLEVALPFDRRLGVYWPVVKPKRVGDFGACVFFNERGLCDLHDIGLKPIGGQLAIHNLPDNGLDVSIAASWSSPAGIATARRFGAPEKVLDLLTKFSELKTVRDPDNIKL